MCVCVFNDVVKKHHHDDCGIWIYCSFLIGCRSTERSMSYPIAVLSSSWARVIILLVHCKHTILYKMNQREIIPPSVILFSDVWLGMGNLMQV